MLKALRNKKGFTLIELIITITILLIVLGLVTSLVTFFTRFYSDENSQLSRQENLRLLALQIEKDIRQSDQVVTEASGCYFIGSTSPIKYCKVGTDVTRNDNVIAREIEVFSLGIQEDTNYLDLEIEAIADTRGSVVNIETRIFLRVASGGE